MSESPAPLPDPSQAQPQPESHPQSPPAARSRPAMPDDPPRIEAPAAEMARAAAEGLSDNQRNVMTYLAAGHSIAKAAEFGHVSRRTVYRWLDEDAHFCAVYNTWRRELTKSAQTRLLAMADDAVDTIHNAILAGNVTASLSVARSMGVLTKPHIGPDDPERIVKRRRARAMRKAAADLKAVDNARSQLPHGHPSSTPPKNAPTWKKTTANAARNTRKSSRKTSPPGANATAKPPNAAPKMPRPRSPRPTQPHPRKTRLNPKTDLFPKNDPTTSSRDARHG